MPDDDIVNRINAELDPVVFGPPASRRPRRPRRPARVRGDQEKAVDFDLRAMPKAIQRGALAESAREVAQRIDSGALSPRDEIDQRRELRQIMAMLFEQAPGEGAGDSTDELRRRREERMEHTG